MHPSVYVPAAEIKWEKEEAKNSRLYSQREQLDKLGKT